MNCSLTASAFVTPRYSEQVVRVRDETHLEGVVRDEHDPEFMRSSKVRREMDNVLKCFKEVYKQKMKAATQVSIMKFFKKTPSESASISSSEPSTSTRQPATPE